MVCERTISSYQNTDDWGGGARLEGLCEKPATSNLGPSGQINNITVLSTKYVVCHQDRSGRGSWSLLDGPGRRVPPTIVLICQPGVIR